MPKVVENVSAITLGSGAMTNSIAEAADQDVVFVTGSNTTGTHPVIVSRSTPTIAAVETARSAGITLLGFSRESRFNIYSASYRLKGCALPISE